MSWQQITGDMCQRSHLHFRWPWYGNEAGFREYLTSRLVLELIQHCAHLYLYDVA